MPVSYTHLDVYKRQAADYSFPETASDACDEHSRTRPEADRGNMSAEGLPIDSAVAKHLSLSLLAVSYTHLDVYKRQI